MLFLLAALGCGCGGIVRHLLNQWISSRYGARFPWGSLFVNATGSLLLGLCLAYSKEGTELMHPNVRVFFAVGFCGGLTTFSTFSMQTFALVGEQRLKAAIINVMLSLLSCLIAIIGGFQLGETFFG